MKLRFRHLLALPALFLASGALAACGGDDDPDTASPASGQSQTQQQDSAQDNGATGPASANDERPDAPDDAISDRPGGPKDKSGDESVGKTEEVGKKGGSVSGGISVDEAPVSPESP